MSVDVEDTESPDRGEIADDADEGLGQRFLPGDCGARLPVGEVRRRSVFWRLTALDITIDTDETVDDGSAVSGQPPPGRARWRLGLPIGLIAPEWAKRRPVRELQTGEVRVSAGADGVFLPSHEVALASQRRVPRVAVGDLDALEAGRVPHVSVDGAVGTLRLGERTLAVLLRDGEAYARVVGADGRRTGTVVVTLLVTRSRVPELDPGAREVPVTVDGRAVLVPVDAERRRLLRSGTPVTVRSGPDALLLVPRRTEDGLEAPEVDHDFDDGTAVTIRSTAKKESMAEAKEAAAAEAYEEAKREAKQKAKEKAWPHPARILPRYEIGVATPIEQTWSLLGLERGALVGSISLEPGAEAVLEVSTSERSRVERDEQTATTVERSTEVSGTARTTSQVSVDAATELGTTMNAGGSATLPLEGADFGATVATGSTTAIDTTVTSGLERVVEATARSATRFQMSHQVKVVHTSERGSETRAARTLRNPNPGRVLQFLHFEICERHRVLTRVNAPARLVVFVENPSLGAFDIGFVFAHEHVLHAALLAEGYRAGFAAARVLQAQSWFEDSLRKRELQGGQQGVDAATEPAETGDDLPGTGIFQTARQLRDVLGEFLAIDLVREASVLVRNLDPWASSKPSRDRVRKAEARFSRWGFWARFTAAYPGVEDRAVAFVALELDGAEHATEEEVVAALQTLTDGLDDDWLIAVKTVVVATVVAVALSLLTGPAAGILQPFLIGLLLLSDDLGLPAVVTRARRELPGERALQQGKHLAVADAAPVAGAEAAALPPPPEPPQIVPDVELAMANADFEKLRRHLEAHRTYYENAIWSAEDPNDRFVRLDVAGVAGFVDNVLLGFTGNRAMYPLRLDALPEDTADGIRSACGATLATDYPEKFPVTGQTISLPTAAVHTQAYVGECDLLEPYMLERRRLDLAEREAGVRRGEAVADQHAAEAERLQARLAADPPILDPPWPTPPAGPDSDDTGELLDG